MSLALSSQVTHRVADHAGGPVDLRLGVESMQTEPDGRARLLVR
jgi:hypothetical protein